MNTAKDIPVEPPKKAEAPKDKAKGEAKAQNSQAKGEAKKAKEEKK